MSGETSRPMATPALPYELDAMALARNYYDWLSRVFAPHLHGTVVEHGAGTGLLSERLRRQYAAHLVLVEPDPGLHPGLQARLGGPDTEIFPGTIEELHGQRGGGLADAVISANVLEHVPDDVACLAAIAGLLRPGGHLGLYVPARPELFGSLDVRFEHRRRYDRHALVAQLEASGLQVVYAQYRNLVGALGWWVSGKLIRRTDLPPRQVRFYDSFVFPATSAIEARFPPPYGQNLLVLARKPA
jgi:SAM-dependent methyltransferase